MADLTVTAKSVRPLPGATIRDFVASAALNTGDAVYVDSNGKVAPAKGDAATTALAIGIALSAGAIGATAAAVGDTVSVCVDGPVAGFSSLTPGNLAFLSAATAGKLADAAPSASLSVTFIVGLIIDTDKIWIDTEYRNTQSAVGNAAAATAAALTDNSTGAAGATLAAGVNVHTIALYVNLADLGNADLLTTYTPGFAFKILAMHAAVEKPATTAAKAATLSPKISGTLVTGGVLALTSANMTPQGAVVAGTNVTAANTGTNTDTISITGSAVTTFVEGAAWILIRLQNMDAANAVASLAAQVNALITDVAAIRTALNNGLLAMRKNGSITF